MRRRVRTGWLLLVIALSIFSAAVIAVSDQLPVWPAWLLMGVASFVGGAVGDRIDEASKQGVR